MCCRLRGLLFAVLALAVLVLPFQVQADVRIRDDRGVSMSLARSPQRIVSLLPSLTEGVCALGACDRLVGTDRFSNYPEQVRALPKLGGIEDAQVERIAALRPDVVLVEPSARATQRLESLGLKVVVIDAKTHADVQRSLQLLGELLERQADVQPTWARIESEVAAARARVPAAVRGLRVYFEVDSTPYAAGAGSFIGETLSRLGMGNVVPPALGPFPRLNPEFVIQARPDIVIAVRRSLDEMPQRPGWSALVALKRGHSCGFELERYELLVRPGPRMGEAAGLLADCLQAVARRQGEAGDVRR